ncbi:mechanosensitive ion channel domain-containing protein [Halorussus litoreus]|uniref:mechanosensitive ion channel domain-containing protein n=1 Tax=Halorussus litoreus TaxID=1710536 RepID=UPI000E2864F8|nr:mechanosensitive ion channel domain-containing protein [Halorussus litoreus]
MVLFQFGPFDGVLNASLVELRATFVDLLPKLVTGFLFLALAYVTIRFVLGLVRSALDRAYVDDQDLVVDLFTTVAGIFLWFAAGLTLLKILGMGEIAASLGTATGFVALGVSYALSDMIADTVSGVYLLRDPDFNPGDSVEVGSASGVVREIGLRKTRLEVEGGDVLVLANGSVEDKWTKKAATESDATAETAATATNDAEIESESPTDDASESSQQ